MRSLKCKVVIQDLVGGVDVGKRNKLLVLGDILPVVNKHGLDVIRDRNLNRRSVVKVLLLKESISAVNLFIGTALSATSRID